MLNVPNNWSSRSLRSVRTTSVGFSIAGMLDDLAGVERHQQALARTLGVPDHADFAVAIGAVASRCGQRRGARRGTGDSRQGF